MRPALILLGWVAALAVVFGFGPPPTDTTSDEVVRMLTGRVEGIEPLVVMLFSMLGVWPVAMGMLLWPEQGSSRVPYWPFGLLSMGLGMYGLGPYFAARDPKGALSMGRFGGWTQSRGLAWGLFVLSVALLGYGVALGNGAAFADRFATEQFIFAMTVDWGLFAVAAAVVVRQDAIRRDAAGLAWMGAVPLFGVLVYLARRPRL
ncbi:MAG: hypothetical protein AAGA54_35145 [Myxococcota bacterium]